MTLSSPDQLNQIILLGIEEIIGMAETKSLLTRANLPEWNHPVPSDPEGTSYSFHFANQLQTSLEKNYGLLAGRGLNAVYSLNMFHRIFSYVFDDILATGRWPAHAC